MMPQHLTPAWIKELGEEGCQEIHQTWLHRLANLTLTGYNAKYSNSPFQEKRDMESGFADSHLYLNSWISSQEHWTLAELEQRNQMLMAKALKIWPLPEANFKPKEKQLDSYCLEDDVDLSGREIARFRYMNTEQPVTSWIDMFEQVLKILHASDKSVLSRLAYGKGASSGLADYVSSKSEELRSSLQIDTDIFVEKNTSTNSKISMLHKFFKEFGANEEDLVFYLKDANKDTGVQDSSPRFELRRRYWAFALPYIQQANSGDENGQGCFRNCNPVKENWISGFFGIGGFGISCVANYDNARVELGLATGSKERNKEAFDYLYSRKEEIENALGTSLEWVRSQDTKGSYLRKHLDNVSIDQESDWTQMAKFHAEWSKKLYDVLVPYLKKQYINPPLFSVPQV